VTEIRPLADEEVERVVAAGLGLARLPLRPGDVYLVAWDGDEPLGHAHLTDADPPEVGDVEVLASQRGRGIGTEILRAVEHAAARRRHARLRLHVSAKSEPAQALYRRLGYVDTGLPPKRVKGTIRIRSGPLEVDDTLLVWEKRLEPVDSGAPRSS
jgi:ribosomal protein S18 acetylase RimI-like enzyme